MARVVLKEGEKPLSGTYGYLTFRTINGQIFVREKPELLLPKNATPEQKEKRKKRLVIDDCVSQIQTMNPNIREAISQRKVIYERVERLYKKHVQTTKAKTKLLKAILRDYWQNQTHPR